MGRESIVHLGADQGCPNTPPGQTIRPDGPRPRDERPSGRHVSVTLPHAANACAMAKATERFSAITRRNSIPSRYRMVRFFHTHPNRYRFFILEKKYRRRKTRWRVNGKGRRERPVGKEPSWLTSATSPICARIMTGSWNWLTACRLAFPIGTTGGLPEHRIRYRVRPREDRNESRTIRRIRPFGRAIRERHSRIHEIGAAADISKERSQELERLSKLQLLEGYSNLDFDIIVRRPKCLTNQSFASSHGSETEASEACVSNNPTSTKSKKE